MLVGPERAASAFRFCRMSPFSLIVIQGVNTNEKGPVPVFSNSMFKERGDYVKRDKIRCCYHLESSWILSLL